MFIRYSVYKYGMFGISYRYIFIKFLGIVGFKGIGVLIYYIFLSGYIIKLFLCIYIYSF